MLRTDSRWNLQVKKPVTKKSICHWVWLGGRRASTKRSTFFCPTLKRAQGASARELGVYARSSPQQPKTGPIVGMPSRRASEPTARGVRAAGCPSRLHQPRNPPSEGFVRQTPRVDPKHRARSAPFSGVPLPLGRAEVHGRRARAQVLDSEAVGSSYGQTYAKPELRRE